MRLRLVAPLVAALALLAAGSSGGSTTLSLDPFEAHWKVTFAPVDSGLDGERITIREASKAVATSLIGPPFDASYFNVYCGPSAGVVSYLTFKYTWGDRNNTMGGCISKKGGPHIIYVGDDHDAGDARIKEVNGLGVLTGVWTQIRETTIPKYKFTAELPTVTFSVVEQGHKALPKNQDAKFELSKVIGRGAVTFSDDPAENPVVADGKDGTGTIRFHKWRVFAHGVVDEDDLVLKVQTGKDYDESDDGDRAARILVRVTRADRDETDHCAVGASGKVVLLDRQDKDDVISIKIPHCNVDEDFYQGIKGSKVAALLKLEKP
jgi:hypothetical protein